MNTPPIRCPKCKVRYKTDEYVRNEHGTAFAITRWYVCGSAATYSTGGQRHFTQVENCKALALALRLEEMTANRDDLLKVIKRDHAEFAEGREALSNLLDLIDDLKHDHDDNRYDEQKWHALSHSSELSEAEQFLQSLDGGASTGPQSADRQSLNLGAPMTTQQSIAEVVRILSMIAALTPFKYDDTAVAFVIWAQDQPWFIALVERIRPASSPEELETQSLLFEPEALASIQQFGRESGRQLTGKYGELLSLIFQVIAWVKAHQAS
jgi:hypothetical protein